MKKNRHVYNIRILALLIFIQPTVSLLPLHKASESGNVELVKQLLKDGADIDAQNEYGRTALHEAARYDHTEVIELLVNRTL